MDSILKKRRITRDTFTGDADNIMRLSLTGKLYSHKGCVNCLDWHPDGSLLVSGSDDLKLKFWKIGTEKCVNTIHTNHALNILETKFIPSDPSKVISTGFDGQIHFYDVEKCTPHTSNGIVLVDNFGVGKCIEFIDSSGNSFLSCLTSMENEDGKVYLIDIRESREKVIFSWPNAEISDIKFSLLHPNTFAIANDSGYIPVYDFRNYKFPLSLVPHPNDFSRAASSILWSRKVEDLIVNYKDDAPTRFSMGEQHTISLSENLASYDAVPSYFQGPSTLIYKGNCVRSYEGRDNSLTVGKNMALYLNERFLTTGSDCGRIFFWDFDTGKLIRAIPADADIVNVVCPSRDETLFAASGIDFDIKIFSFLDDHIGKSNRNEEHFRKAQVLINIADGNMHETDTYYFSVKSCNEADAVLSSALIETKRLEKKLSSRRDRTTNTILLAACTAALKSLSVSFPTSDQSRSQVECLIALLKLKMKLLLWENKLIDCEELVAKFLNCMPNDTDVRYLRCQVYAESLDQYRLQMAKHELLLLSGNNDFRDSERVLFAVDKKLASLKSIASYFNEGHK